MLMFLLYVILAILLLALVGWVINKYLPVDPWVKQIIIVILVLLCVIWLISRVAFP
jgi:hypothetical protein